MRKHFSSHDWTFEQSKKAFDTVRDRKLLIFSSFQWGVEPFDSDDVNATNEHGITRLWYAICNNQNLDEAKRLLEAKANPCVEDRDSVTLIHQVISLHVPLAFIQLLLQYGVGLFVSYDGTTTSLLHIAVYYHNNAVFQHLLARKDVQKFINSLDARRFTPLDSANFANITHFSERLMEEGAVQGKHICSWHPYLVAKRKAVKETIVVLMGLVKRLHIRWMPLDMRRLLATTVHKTRFADPWYKME